MSYRCTSKHQYQYQYNMHSAVSGTVLSEGEELPQVQPSETFCFEKSRVFGLILGGDIYLGSGGNRRKPTSNSGSGGVMSH